MHHLSKWDNSSQENWLSAAVNSRKAFITCRENEASVKLATARCSLPVFLTVADSLRVHRYDFKYKLLAFSSVSGEKCSASVENSLILA